MAHVYIDPVVTKCLIKKNYWIFYKNNPDAHTLATLNKTIISSKIDFEIIAYGGASASNPSKIDKATRTILHQIYTYINPTLWS